MENIKTIRKYENILENMSFVKKNENRCQWDSNWGQERASLHRESLNQLSQRAFVFENGVSGLRHASPSDHLPLAPDFVFNLSNI
jgi:hypothetical protein